MVGAPDSVGMPELSFVQEPQTPLIGWAAVAQRTLDQLAPQNSERQWLLPAGHQRKVGTVGKPLWTGLIASFPDLSNTVHTITSNDDGDVVAQVDIGGTQQLAWGLITPAGQHYREPHLFIFGVGPDLLIDSITAYWNDADISQQLGHTEVD